MFHFLLLLIAVTHAFDERIHSLYKKQSRTEFVDYFNGLNLSFSIGNHEFERHHCSFIGNNSMVPKIHHDLGSLQLPDAFDSRQKWPQCSTINEIRNQLDCGSCWMFGAATTATDRNCIHANIDTDLSEQDLSCCGECAPEGVCKGGNPQAAFEFWIRNGLVSNDCTPYDSNALKNRQYCSKRCVNGKDYNEDKNYGGEVYGVSSDEEQIKAELYNNGPIEASMVVYDDFEQYTGGIYTHTYGQNRGYHSVRMIGYGEEGGIKYWLIANSWGTGKGENGFYRIKQFQPEIKLEDSLLAVMPKR